MVIDFKYLLDFKTSKQCFESRAYYSWDLFCIVLKFRKHNIVSVGDIEKNVSLS